MILYKQKVIQLFLSLVIVTSISGCSSDLVKDAGSMLKDLGTSADEEKEKGEASTLEMMVYAQNNINLNSDNEPTPVSFVVVQLSNDTRLNSSDYETLSGDIKTALGESYLKHEEFIVEPGKFVHIDEFPLEKGARNLAVISAYRAVDHTIWRASVKVQDKGESYSVHTALKANEVSMEVQ